MSTSIIPDISASGLWVLKEPFNTLLLTETPYTCVAVRKTSDLLKIGEDPKKFYTDKGLADTVYAEDLKVDVCIISLQCNSTGDIVYVPSTYILSYPKGSGVPYSMMGLAISLGAMPESTDLTYLKQRMKDIVTETVGVEGTVHQLSISTMQLMDQDSHKRLEVARVAKITINKTDRELYLEEQAKNEALTTRVAELEAYILSLNP